MWTLRSDEELDRTLQAMIRVAVVFVVCALLAPSSARAQSLAEVARQEEARRKAVKEPGKVYTNTDLRPDITKSEPPASSPGTADKPAPADGAKPSAEAKEASPDKAKDAEQVKDQAYWSGRIGGARSALERSRIFADALQSRLNALTADFVNRDDPAQRSQIELERQRATNELARVNKEIAEQTKAIADIEEEARKAGVPPGWLR
jgi:hypothetical protein